MSKDISTVPGKTYVVTLSQAGELSGRTDAGEALVLAGSDAAGQVSFQAISQVTTCSDDGATVLPFCDAPLPIGVDGGASAMQVAGMVDAAIYEFEPVSMETVEGSANATCHYIELDAQHVPQGRLESISLRARSGNNPATLSYLAVWELEEDGTTWSYLGSSLNNPGQVMNRVATWEFAEGEVELAGRKLRILAQAERSGVWETGPQLGVWTGSTPEGDESKCFRNGTGYAFLPELSIAVQQPVARFAPAAHVEDATAHLSADEHRLLTGMRLGSPQGAIPALIIKGGDGSALLVMRGNQTNVSVTGAQLSFNVPRMTAMSDCPVLYRYDAETGASDVWFAGASDGALLAPLGLTEPGTYAGVPSLPMCLRGSELRFNGSALDVAALAQLAAHKDELLALLNTGQAQVDDSGEPG